MSDCSLLVLAPAFDAGESALGIIKLARIDLPNAAKFVVTRGKFDTGSEVSALNVDSGYPAEIAQLQSLATAAGKGFRDDPCFRDGYDLFCAGRLIEKRSGADQLLLLRDPADVEQWWPDLSHRAAEGLFAVGGQNERNLLLNLVDPRTRYFLDLAQKLYRTGAAFAISPYRLEAALAVAGEALALVDSLTPAPSAPCSADQFLSR